MYIYILELANNKYYVGKTANVKQRFAQHCAGEGSEWTRLHKPKRVVQYIQCDDPMAEDIYTKKYMMRWGIENVRGGSYSQVALFDWQVKSLEHEFKTTRDRCFKCGMSGHFAKDCITEPLANVKPLAKSYNNIKNIIASINDDLHTNVSTANVNTANANAIENNNINATITIYGNNYRQLTLNNNNYGFGTIISFILNNNSERKYGYINSQPQNQKLYAYELKEHLRTVIHNKKHLIDMFHNDMYIMGLGNNIYDKIYTFIFGEEPVQKAQYQICANGANCIGCVGSDRCNSSRIEMLYVDDFGIVYNDYTEIYEKCKGKYNYMFHPTGKYV